MKRGKGGKEGQLGLDVWRTNWYDASKQSAGDGDEMKEVQRTSVGLVILEVTEDLLGKTLSSLLESLDLVLGLSSGDESGLEGLHVV